MRKYFQRKLLGTHVLALVLVCACLLLSHWQWNRAHYARQAKPVSAPVSFEQLSKARDFLPPTSVGQLTKVSGIWQEKSRILLRHRPADGRKLLATAPPASQIESGNWIVDLLGLPDGTSVAVVRGWQNSKNSFPQASGPAKITGVVQPAEDAPNEVAVIANPLLTTKFLLSKSQTDMRDGFIVESSVNGQLTQVVPSHKSFTSNGLRTLNVFYTLNWLFFAFLILLIWIRIVREEVSSAR